MLSVRKIIKYISKVTAASKILGEIILISNNNKCRSSGADIVYGFIKRHSGFLAPQISQYLIILYFANWNEENVESILKEHFKHKEYQHENKGELEVHNAWKFIS